MNDRISSVIRMRKCGTHGWVEVGYSLTTTPTSPSLFVGDPLAIAISQPSRSTVMQTPLAAATSGEPIDGVSDTLGVVRYQPSESRRQASSERFFLSLESSRTSAHDGTYRKHRRPRKRLHRKWRHRAYEMRPHAPHTTTAARMSRGDLEAAAPETVRL